MKQLKRKKKQAKFSNLVSSKYGRRFMKECAKRRNNQICQEKIDLYVDKNDPTRIVSVSRAVDAGDLKVRNEEEKLNKPSEKERLILVDKISDQLNSIVDKYENEGSKST